MIREKDGHVWEVVPAHAGVILVVKVDHAAALGGSRTRGGDPVFTAFQVDSPKWFPHTRG